MYHDYIKNFIEAILLPLEFPQSKYLESYAKRLHSVILERGYNLRHKPSICTGIIQE